MQETLKVFFEQWLQQAPRPAGVMAWGMQLPDRTTINRSFWDGFPEASLNNAWRCVADTLHVLRSQRCPGQRIRWVFEHHWIYCAVRPDGAFFGVFTTNQSAEIDEPLLEHMLMDFLALAVA